MQAENTSCSIGGWDRDVASWGARGHGFSPFDENSIHIVCRDKFLWVTIHTTSECSMWSIAPTFRASRHVTGMEYHLSALGLIGEVFTPAHTAGPWDFNSP